MAEYVGGRSAAECKAEWDRRRQRWTAAGQWVGHSMDRRVLAGRTVEQEDEIARRELELRLASLECRHTRALVPSDARGVYRRSGGRWHCDACGADTPPVGWARRGGKRAPLTHGMRAASIRAA